MVIDSAIYLNHEPMHQKILSTNARPWSSSLCGYDIWKTNAHVHPRGHLEITQSWLFDRGSTTASAILIFYFISK
ncbi:unnamed protein product [Amoebophrya sp. A120]|nr:unnamed protein product [Amoebophrya sp. A120]|eukprot:GSA120T00008845001.1